MIKFIINIYHIIKKCYYFSEYFNLLSFQYIYFFQIYMSYYADKDLNYIIEK